MSIDSIVRHYINDSKCEGALMINGKWGLGKSFYLREKLIPSLKEENPDLQFIYVSLNGVTDQGQLPDLIAMEKWPFRKTKTFKVGV